MQKNFCIFSPQKIACCFTAQSTNMPSAPLNNTPEMLIPHSGPAGLMQRAVGSDRHRPERWDVTGTAGTKRAWPGPGPVRKPADPLNGASSVRMFET